MRLKPVVQLENIAVRASGKLSIIAGNSISSSTFGAADAGQVNIQGKPFDRRT